MKFSIDPWDVAYGSAMESMDLEASEAEIGVEIEMAEGEWRPVDAPSGAVGPEAILFVDGVRRVDARVWIENGDGADPGICATYAAGVVCCDGRAELVDAVVERAMFSASTAATDIATKYGDYPARMAPSSTPEALAIALQDRMLQTEVQLADRVRKETSAALLVVDGPLRSRAPLPDTIGFVKTHNVQYLSGEENKVVAQLTAGQRTPVFFLTSGGFSRYSWYLRLPGPDGAPWAGVVRCECSADASSAEAIALATLASACLPRFASQPHKDARAPQNLYPIAGLERELRRRLGDQQLMYRGLRVAAMGAVA